MAKLETVARLMGHSIAWAEGETFYSHRVNGEHKGWCESPMPYDTDANASRELLAHVAKERRVIEFVTDLHRIIGDAVISDCGSNWAMLNATPQQIYDAFCATFARELEQVEKQP